MDWVESFGAKIVDAFGGKLIPTLTKSFELTGYRTMKNREALIDACCQTRENADIRPADGETFCNVAVAYIATKMGCTELSGLLANDMIDYFSAKPDSWETIDLKNAQNMANQGSLVIAGHKDIPHGHVCVIMPGIAKTSGHWNAQAPACINVGREVFIGKGLNYAFKEIPTLWAWRPSL